MTLTDLIPFTAHLLPPGGMIVTPSRLIRVPEGHVGVDCEGCEWYTIAPTREAAGELVRVMHMKVVHGEDVQMGRATVWLGDYRTGEGIRFDG